MTYAPPVADRATARGVERLVEVARAFHAEPNNDERRLTFLKATFNLDRTAALIVSLADQAASPAERPDLARDEPLPEKAKGQ